MFGPLLAIFRVILYNFFREIIIRASHKIPAKGPIIFCAAPHANQFIDPIMLLITCSPRTMGFLTAKKSMEKRIIGAFASFFDPIPVSRPQDLITNGKGTVKILVEKGVATITGNDTLF